MVRNTERKQRLIQPAAAILRKSATSGTTRRWIGESMRFNSGHGLAWYKKPRDSTPRGFFHAQASVANASGSGEIGPDSRAVAFGIASVKRQRAPSPCRREPVLPVSIDRLHTQ